MKDLIILAKGGTKNQCPFDGVEVWGVNDVGSSPEFKDKHIDRIFTFDPRTPDFLKEAKSIAPIWSWRDYADVHYPLNEVIQKLKTSYFTNTLSYMLALAIYEGYERIRMYGVDAPYGGIYFMEKSGLEYWIGRAQQSGIEIITAEGSDLLRTHDGLLYGQRGECSIQLYLSERMYLLNILPKDGDYEDIYRINLCRWLLSLKVKEKEFHKIQLGSSPNGQISFQCDHEFQSTIHFPFWVLSYLRTLIIRLEREKRLPVHLISVYDKFVKLNMPEEVGDTRNPYRKIRISYILNVKNRASFLIKTFENLKKLLTPDDELIVIDGNSTDGSKEVIDRYRYLIDTYVSEPDLSGSHALNKGILLARGKYVKQYPADDVIYPLDEAVNYMELNSDVDLLVLGGVKRSALGEDRISFPKSYGDKTEDVFNYGACGTGFFIRKSSFAKIGLFDPVDINADREFAVRSIVKGKVRFLNGNFYWHGIWTSSSSTKDLKNWDRVNIGLIKQYCSKGFYLRMKLRSLRHRR